MIATCPAVTRIGSSQSLALALQAERVQMARAFARLQLTGAVLVTVWMLFPAGPELDRPLLSLLVLVGIVPAIVFLHWSARPQLRVITACMTITVLLVSAGVYLSGGPESPLVIFYGWVAAFAAWYLPWRQITLLVGAMIGSYGAAIASFRDPGETQIWQVSSTDAAHWMLMAGTVIAFAVVVRSFRNTLHDREQQFQLGFERSETPMAIADLGGRLVQVNDAYCRLLGRGADDLSGTAVQDLTYLSDRRSTERWLDDAAAGAPSIRMQKRLIRADGTPVWVELNSTVVRDRRGRPLHLFAHVLDLTVQREAERALEQRASREAALADIGRQALQAADRQQFCEYVAGILEEQLEAASVVVLEHDGAGERFRVLAANADGAFAAPNEVIEAPGSLAALALFSDSPVLVEDWRSPAGMRRSPLERDPVLRSGIAAQIRGYDRPFGVLIVESARPNAFGPSDEFFLRAVANTVGETLEAQRAREELAYEVLHDPLTGLGNRERFAELLRQTLERPTSGPGGIALLLLDLDHFKLVNDSLGHVAGDYLLREVALRLTQLAARPDAVARISADEFAILIDDVADQPAAASTARRILDAVQLPFRLEAEEIMLAATAGLVVSDGSHTAESLLRDAAAAMHVAKERSRGGFEVFESHLVDRNVGLLRTETALRRAQAAGDLRLLYQPIIDLPTGRAVGAEALLRWTHEEWGPVSPAEFIPIAERSGLIIPIGRQVITDSCAQLASWREGGREQFHVHLNVSALQLHDDTLVEFIARTLKETAVPAGLLTLELTETAVIADSEIAGQTLNELNRLGIRLALDDFGTGYASLSYLNSFPFDVIKLDRTLIQNLETSRKDEIIAASSIEMSHALGLQVVAEGIETEAQAIRLRAHGCDLAQGYLYGRPMPAHELGRMLAGRGSRPDPTQRLPRRATVSASG
jgi:diguanylate cyclase (GGDEF)-like protein/PAS domain S-box-containing protein